MRVQLTKYWIRLRSSFWFLPSLTTAGAVALAFATIALDETVTSEWVLARGWAYTGSAEGASAILGAIASSMMTIAGVVFSMTLVALTLASSQFGPRLLRNFMRDTVNQLVLGTFVATFLYCLLVLGSLRHGEEDAFVPHLSITVGVLLALASLSVFIYFIHHVSVTIQADSIVTRVAEELIAAIDRLFPARIGKEVSRAAHEPPDAGLLDALEREASPVAAARDGYLQLIDADALMALATEEDVVLRLEHRPGHYIVADRPLVRVWPGNRVTDSIVQRVNAAFVVGAQRTPKQDVEFSVNQLVEVAVRALSPGVNDPFTAITCIDRLGSALSRMAQREIPSPFRRDEHRRVRVIAPLLTFPAVTAAAFDQIRQYARSSAAVTIRLLETITLVAEFVRRSEDRAALRFHAEMIVRGADGGLPEPADREAVGVRYQTASRALREP